MPFKIFSMIKVFENLTTAYRHLKKHDGRSVNLFSPPKDDSLPLKKVSAPRKYLQTCLLPCSVFTYIVGGKSEI